MEVPRRSYSGARLAGGAVTADKFANVARKRQRIKWPPLCSLPDQALLKVNQMLISRAALRIILLKEEGRRWREEIDDLDEDGIYVSAAYLSFTGLMMFCSIGIIAAQILSSLIFGEDVFIDWFLPVVAVPFYGMVLGFALCVTFRALYTLRKRDSGWYWWPLSIRIIATLLELISLAGTILLFVYVI